MFGIRWFVIGSLALISGGTVLADDTSKTGGWYVIVDEEGNAVVPEQVDLSTDDVFTLRDPASTSCEDVDSAVAVYYELPYEQGRPVVIEQASCSSPRLQEIRAAETEARGWPDFDSTSLGDKATAAGAPEFGYFLVVDRHGNTFKVPSVDAGLPRFLKSEELRSIQWIEDAPNETASNESLPDYGHTANGRSISLIESKEAPVEFGLAPHYPF